MTGETPPAAKGVTDEMVEAAARKLCRLDGYDPDGRKLFGPKVKTWEAYAKTAEAALEAALSLPAPGEGGSERKRGERENTAFHEWWKRSGHAADATFTLTMQNCAHAAWQARALSATGDPDDAELLEAAERQIESLLSTPSSGGLAVKELEWQDCEPGHTNGHNGRRIVEKAVMSFGAYFIEHDQDDDTWWLVDGLIGPVIAGPFNETWEARSAAHDLFNTAILSTLDRTTLTTAEGEKA
jgi:hypothetical protein